MDVSAAEFGYRPVYVRGQFLHDQELFVAPRTHDGEVGAHVVTPLRLVSGCVLARSADLVRFRLTVAAGWRLVCGRT